MSIRLVLFGAKRKPDILDQDSSLLVESCSNCWIVLLLVLRHMILKSSAYNRGIFGLSILSEMSLIAIRNSVTEIVDSWGTRYAVLLCKYIG